MQRGSQSAPAWLFAFVDLAFLLVIAMTQFDVALEDPVELGEVVLSQIETSAARELPERAPDLWQVRVLTTADGALPPYELGRPSAAEPATAAERLAFAELRARLASLHASHAPKPLLAADAESHSRDLLGALALLDEYWPSDGRAMIAPVSAGPRRP